MSTGFPNASLSFNRGQDILYRQFNDIDIYVEDTGKERMYFQIFKTLLPGIALSKIFSLGGKDNVILNAQSNSTDKRKIYLVDLDFDSILGRKKVIRNLIYLKRYSIENYFIDEESIKEQIRENKPSILDSEISVLFNFKAILSSITTYLQKPAIAAIVIQRFNLRVSYPSISFYDYKTYCESGGIFSQTINDFFADIESALKEIDGRFTLSAKLKAESATIQGISPTVFIPGKWILTLIKESLRNKKLIIQKKDDSFYYALAKDVNINNLSFIASEIDTIRQ